MIDFFTNIYQIFLPEGEVESIHDNNNELLWEKAKIYGVNWEGNTSPEMSRTDNSILFSSPVIGVGTTQGSSPFDNCYPWSEIITEEINGNIFVKIPKFWFKWTKNGTTMKLQIADKPIPNFLISPMHANRGDGKGERDYAYIAKYKCNSQYQSINNASLLNNISIETARNAIKNQGTGFYQQDFASFWTLRMLFLVEFATWDGQTVLSPTAVFSSITNIKTGETSTMSYHTGISANGHSVQYRYVEDPWSNLLEWIDGIYFSNTDIYCINNPNDFSTGSNGIKIGSRNTGYGYIKSWTIPTTKGFEYALFPEEVVSSNSYTMDGYYYQNAGTVLYIGGSRSSMEVHGPWFFYTDFTSSQTSSSIVCRMMYLP